MIVQCSNCKAKFRLQEALVKAGGARVRCSLCKHTFTVHPPPTAVVPPLEPEGKLRGEAGRAVEMAAFRPFPGAPAAEKKGAHDEELEKLFEEMPEDIESAGVPATGVPDLLDVGDEAGRGRRGRHREEGFTPAGFEKRAAAYAEKRSVVGRFIWGILLAFLILAGAASRDLDLGPPVDPEIRDLSEAPASTAPGGKRRTQACPGIGHRRLRGFRAERAAFS